jgi:hypothetical protein
VSILQVSELPDGTTHTAVLGQGRGMRALLEALEQIAAHSVTHAHPLGGCVGIAPVDGGFAVQVHAPDGTIESWRIVIEQE